MAWLMVCVILAVQQQAQAQPQQRIVQGPSDTNTKLGQTVLLKCRVEAQQGAVQWVKNGFGLGNDRQLAAFERYSMQGSTSQGEYHLRIEGVLIEDDDVYECQLQAAGNNPARISRPAKLTVLVEPAAPQLQEQSNRAVLRGTAGEAVHQSCISEKGKPPANIRWVIAHDAQAVNVVHWLDGSNQDVTTRDSHHVHIAQQVRRSDQRTYTVISNISFTPRAEEDGKYVACVASHETYSSLKTHSALMQLQYAPIVDLQLDNSSVLREHGSALLLCNVQAKPLRDVRIVWYRNGKAITSVTSDTLAFPKLRIDHHQSQYVCLASNSVGESSASYVLNISYGAHFMSSEQHQAVSPGEDAFFHCEAIGNPKPQIHWVKAGDNQTIARGSNLTMRSVQSWQRGEYECIAAVEGFPSASLTNYLHIRGPPSVSLTEELFAAVDESAEIVCEVRGRPQPKDVLWTLDGAALDYGRPGGRIQVHQVPRQFGVESKVVVQHLKETDFGLYNCTAFNQLGNHSQTMRLQKNSVVDAVMKVIPWSYALPIAALVLLLTVLVCCVVWRCCRTYSSPINEEQTDVTIKCEALDGGQFFPEMYSSSPLENTELICSKDYVPIPQSNPDLDYLPPPTFMGNVYQPYFSSPLDYNQDVRFEPSYGSFTSGMSTPGAVPFSDLYSCNNPSRVENALETLPEVATPDMESGTPLLPSAARVHDRPLSRTSTHV